MNAKERDEWLAEHLRICTMEPMYNHIIIKRLNPLDSIGLMIVPDVAKETPDEGFVVKVAPVFEEGFTLDKGSLPYLPGERVLLKKFAGKEICIGGVEDQEYVLLKWDDVIAYVPAAADNDAGRG